MVRLCFGSNFPADTGGMLGFHSNQRFYVCIVPVDMRKGIDGLCGVVRHILEDNPMSGYVFIFFNKDRDKVKLLVWDADGYVLYHKRLERGSFEILPGKESKTKESMRYDQLVMLISGISIRHAVQRKRYSPLSTISA